jgi:hypothetical protein
MSSSNKKLLAEIRQHIKETAHDANVGRGYAQVGNYKSTKSTLGGETIKGYASTGIYVEPPRTLADADELDDDSLDKIISLVSLKTDGTSGATIDPDPHGRARKDNRTMGGNPLGESPRMRSAGYPSNSLGMVTPASRALNSPKSVRATVKTGKGTATSGYGPSTVPPRPTGSIRDFSAGTKDLNQSVLDEPVYDLSDILVHKDDDRGNIDKIKKLTWILQNSGE